ARGGGRGGTGGAGGLAGAGQGVKPPARPGPGRGRGGGFGLNGGGRGVGGGEALGRGGMPIYNGGKVIRESPDSLLAQDYENIEVIITDNTSTDGTEFICREYAARDRRVRYVRNEYNVGAIENFNRAFRLGAGPYFMWASGHDLRSTGSISKCVEVLERNPD